MGRLGRVAWKLPNSQSFEDGSTADSARLSEAPTFGANPGNLRMLKYVPPSAGRSPPLVVVLHGCTQTAASYDRGAGWSTLADEYGFALLFPEQKRVNNLKACFTWFDEDDTRRGAGEAASISNMVEQMIADDGIEPGRVFVTGLSAGGAMTSVMLATYPDVFAAGAIIAGLPYGAANSVMEAFSSMSSGSRRTAEEWGALVRQASRHRGRWPRVSIWHGSADTTVVPLNAEAIVKQWTDVHEAMLHVEHQHGVGYSKTLWRNEDGLEVVESISIQGLAHGTPLAVDDADERCGEAGPFLLEAGVSSTHHIARFFGVLETNPKALAANTVVHAAEKKRLQKTSDVRSNEALWKHTSEGAESAEVTVDVSGVITSALKTAGLIKH